MSQKGAPRVLTVGYGGRTPDEVLDELEEHGVDRVVDVRSIAQSTVEGFSQDELATHLGGRGIDYVHLAELGDFQPDAYPTYMETEEWAQGYQRLLDVLARTGTSCLFSKPQDPGRCHRRFLQARLKEDGYRVVHLTPAGPREAVTLDS